MLTINEILANEKKVVFSYAEDTISITYKPFVFKNKKEYRLMQWVIKHVKKQNKLSKSAILMIQKRFLKIAVTEWDFTNEGEPLSVKKGLKVLPGFFINQLYWTMISEIIDATRV